MKTAYINGDSIRVFDNGLDGIEFPDTIPNTANNRLSLALQGYHFNHASLTISGVQEPISTNKAIAEQESSEADS